MSQFLTKPATRIDLTIRENLNAAVERGDTPLFAVVGTADGNLSIFTTRTLRQQDRAWVDDMLAMVRQQVLAGYDTPLDDCDPTDA